jgi:hypothetical protein
MFSLLPLSHALVLTPDDYRYSRNIVESMTPLLTVTIPEWSHVVGISKLETHISQHRKSAISRFYSCHDYKKKLRGKREDRGRGNMI